MALLPDSREIASYSYPLPPSYYSETNLTIECCVMKIKKYIAQFSKATNTIEKIDISDQLFEWMITTNAITLFQEHGHYKFVQTVKERLLYFYSQGLQQSRDYYKKIFGCEIDE